MRIRYNKWMEQQSKYENVTYAALWGILFAAPLLSLYLRVASDSSVQFNWQEIFIVWRQYVPFLIVFLIHNFLLAPMLVYRQRRWLYSATTAAMLGAFIVYQCNSHPKPMHPRDRMGHQVERLDPPPFERHDEGMRPDEGEQHEGTRPDEFKQHDGLRPDEFKQHDGEARPGFRHHRRDHVPPAFIGQHDIIATVILVLMLGMNLGVKLYFRTRKDQKKLVELEKQNLEQQLEYLKYQINPHFFMNTLNNIHALVDIDPEKAKDTILELSKMMRFILYEGDKSGVPLSREFDFIRHYVALMQLRYTDKVDIRTDLPLEAPDKTVPPLMLISFIENAFKHGISYQHQSFVHIKVEVNSDTLHFSCSNSKAEKPNEEKGGVGLTNVKQRLRLLYDDRFTLRINNNPDSYNVELTIPLT
jgi:hypothetical protein